MDKKERRNRILDILGVFAGGALVGMIWMLVMAVIIIGQDGLSLLQAKDAIEHRFVGEYDREAQMDAMLEAMVDSLGDEWSYYMTEEEFQASRTRSQGRYVGIGITLSLIHI